jgi:hypothetical protein
MKAFDLTPIISNFYGGILETDSRPDWEAYVLIGFPFIVALVGLYSPITDSILSTMITALAILFGFTFSSLLTTAQYSGRGDRLEKQIVQETRIGTSYALLVNLASLISVVLSSIFIADFSQIASLPLTIISVAVYYLLFHYLLVMIYLMRYLYLLAVGGAFEEARKEPQGRTSVRTEEDDAAEIKIDQ